VPGSTSINIIYLSDFVFMLQVSTHSALNLVFPISSVLAGSSFFMLSMLEIMSVSSFSSSITLILSVVSPL